MKAIKFLSSNYKRFLAFVCAVVLLATGAQITLFCTAGLVLNRPTLSTTNFVLKEANESTDFTFTAAGTKGGITEDMPDITATFKGSKALPNNSAVVFYYDFSEITPTSAAPTFDIVFYNGTQKLWNASGRHIANTNPSKGYDVYSVSGSGYNVESYPANQEKPFVAKAGTKGYVVIYTDNKIKSLITNTTAIRLENRADAATTTAGSEFVDKNVYFRDMGFIANAKTAAFKEELDALMNVNNVIDLINKIEAPLTLQSGTLITKARNAYNDLFYKSLVGNYSELVGYETAFAGIDDVAGVIAKIDAIGTVSKTSYNDILTALTGYLFLDDSYKTQVTNYTTLDSAIAEYVTLIDIDDVIGIINSLPADVAFDNEAAVVLSRKAYDALSVEEKFDFSDEAYEKLLDAESVIEGFNLPDFYKDGNFVIIGSNSSANTTGIASEEGISNDFPTLKGDFSSIPADAQAIVFKYDYLDATFTGALEPTININFVYGTNRMWTVTQNKLSPTNNGTPIELIMANADSYSRVSQKEVGFYRPKAGTVGYVVIPVSEEIIAKAQVAAANFDLSKVTEITLTNEDILTGADFVGKEINLRDLGYVKNLEAFWNSLEAEFDTSYNSARVSEAISTISELNEDTVDTLAEILENYSKLSADFKKFVKNYKTIWRYYIRLDRIDDVQAVIDNIAAIGDVSASSEEKIRVAFSSYYFLDDSLKSQVTNYAVLNLAVEKYAKIIGSEGIEIKIAALKGKNVLKYEMDLVFTEALYKTLTIEEKIAFTKYNDLLQLLVDLEVADTPDYFAGNYVVIGAEEPIIMETTANPHGGVSGIDTGNIPVRFEAIPEQAEAIAIEYDFSESVENNNISMLFSFKFMKGDEAIADVGGYLEDGVSVRNRTMATYQVGPDGYSIIRSKDLVNHEPDAGTKGVALVLLDDAFRSHIAKKGLDLSMLTSLKVYNAQGAFGVDFANIEVSYKNVGYILDLEKFEKDYKAAMDFTKITSGTIAMEYSMNINSMNVLKEYDEIYENLSYNAKVLMPNYKDYLQRHLDYANVIDINGVVSKIDAIGTVNKNSFAKIASAAQAFRLLDDSLEAQVTNADKLTTAIDTFIALQDADSVIDIINQLPANIGVNDYSAVLIAGKAYNALSDAEVANVTNASDLKEREAALDYIFPFYATAPDNYVMLDPNEGNSTTFRGTLGNPDGLLYGDLPDLTGAFSLIPEDAEAIVFYYDFMEGTRIGVSPHLQMNASFLMDDGEVRFTTSSAGEYWNTGLEHILIGEQEGTFIEDNRGKAPFYGQPQSKGYCVVPISSFYTVPSFEAELSDVKQITFKTEDWWFGTGFRGATVSLGRLGYIKDYDTLRYALRKQYLPGYQVDVQEAGSIKLNVVDIDGDKVDLSWTSCEGAFTYAVGLYDDKGVCQFVEYVKDNSNYKFTGLSFNTDYKIQVTAVDTDLNAIDCSDVLSIKTREENKPQYMYGIVDYNKELTALGFNINGDSATFYWNWLDGVDHYLLNLYSSDKDGNLTYIASNEIFKEPGEVTIEGLQNNVEYVAQLVSYDPWSSIIFAYSPEKFNLASPSTYIPPVEDDGEIEYVKQTVIETVEDVEIVYNEIESEGKWVRKYEWVVNKAAVYNYILLGAGALLILAAITIFVIIIIKKKKKRVGEA